MKLGKFKPFFIGTGVLLGAIAISVGLNAIKPEAEKEENTKPPLVVRTADAMHKEQTVFSTFQGEVRAKTDIELVTQVTGKVMLVSDKFIEGGAFSAGETLLQIDDADYQVALKSAQANVASAQVEVDIEMATAATNAKEWRELQGKPIEEANPLRLNKPQIDRAKARLDAANAELAAAQLNYNRTKISAPFSGRIMTKSAELGQFMSRGASIGRVFATDAMEVRIPMTDVQINELGLTLGYSVNSNGEKGVPANVSALFGDQQRVWPGYVKSVDASVDNKTRLLFATVVVDKPFEDNGGGIPLVPGLFVDVELASPIKVAGLELPRTALRKGDQVYVYDEDVLHLKKVKVLYTSQDKIIVDDAGSAIAVGEKIITSSVPGAYEGMPIKMVQSEDAVAIADTNIEEGAESEAALAVESEVLDDTNVQEELADSPEQVEELVEPLDDASQVTDEAGSSQEASASEAESHS